MKTWQENLIYLVIRYFLRWLSSNDKNKKVVPDNPKVINPTQDGKAKENHKTPLIDQAFDEMGYGELGEKTEKESE